MALHENKVARKIGFTVTESAANTLTAATVELPIDLGETVFDLDKVQAQNSDLITLAAANEEGHCRFQLQKGNSTPTTMLDYDDKNLLYECLITVSSNATNADQVFRQREEFQPDHTGYMEILANDQVYAVIKSVAAAQVQKFSGILIGSVIKVPSNQLTTMLINELDN